MTLTETHQLQSAKPAASVRPVHDIRCCHTDWDVQQTVIDLPKVNKEKILALTESEYWQKVYQEEKQEAKQFICNESQKDELNLCANAAVADKPWRQQIQDGNQSVPVPGNSYWGIQIHPQVGREETFSLQ